MHLVKNNDVAQAHSRQVGGLAGWVIAWAQAMWLGAKMRHDAKRQMVVIETLSIGGRKQLVLVSCAGEHFLVGTGADSVQTIVRVRSHAPVDERSPAQSFGERP